MKLKDIIQEIGFIRNEIIEDEDKLIDEINRFYLMLQCYKKGLEGDTDIFNLHILKDLEKEPKAIDRQFHSIITNVVAGGEYPIKRARFLLEDFTKFYQSI